MSEKQLCDIDADKLKVSAPKLEYFYGGGRIGNNPNLSGYGIRGFTNKTTGESHSDPFDCIGTGYAKYDETPVAFENIIFADVPHSLVNYCMCNPRYGIGQEAAAYSLFGTICVTLDNQRENRLFFSCLF